MKQIAVKKNQTLFDIALQEYGDMCAVVWLVMDNQLLGVTDNIWEGMSLNIREEIWNPRVKNYLNPFLIATKEAVIAEGIGFWEIEKNFAVS